MESQDRERELELSLFQLPDPPLQLLQPPIRDEAGPSEQHKLPHVGIVEQLWNGNLQDDARALVILLQVGSVELGGHEVTFQGHYQGPNLDQYRETSRPRAGDHGHHRYLDGPVSPLPRDQRAAFVALTLHRILEFLAM
jgi:hypothetical protein